VLKNSLLIYFLCLNLYLFSQEKEKYLPGVRIELSNDSILLSGESQIISVKKIGLYASEDIGALTQKIAGITLKNYGGIGGMKTIAYRGISGTNTAIILDGFALQNTMVGQLDLSNLQVDNVHSLSFTSGVPSDELLPISALMQGNVLSINTFENKQTNDTMEVRYISKVGSFGQFDNYGSYKRSVANSLLSVYAKYRSFSGNYPYTIENGNFSTTSMRKNNQLNEGFGGINYSKDLNPNLKIRTSIHFNQSERGLPGAVILYNETSNQELNQQNTYANVVLENKSEKGKMNIYNSLNYGYLNYIDPSYLNNSGGLNQWYFNTINQTGVTMNRKIKDSVFMLYGGVEHTFSSLTATNQYAFSPKRYHLQSVLGMKATLKTLSFTAQVGNHSLQNQQGASVKNTTAWTTYLQLEKRNYHSLLGLPRAWFKQTFRMPSFSELYYNAIGNKELKPELALQYSVGTSYRFLKNSLHLSLDAYYNKVDNKILAIPTKNLFVWSILNVGRVQILGVDVMLRKNWNLSNKLEIDASFNYAFQKVQDISDEHSTTFKNQLAYFPMHTLQSEISLLWNKKTGIFLSNSSISNRYVLNENSESNKLLGFSTFDLTCYYKMDSYKKNKLKLSLTLKNFTNTTYQYISYFVMPGRNYLMTLSYAFN
jgi:outer membrane cobalamin receptor